MKGKKRNTRAGNRTPITCLEGVYDNHYTTRVTVLGRRQEFGNINLLYNFHGGDVSRSSSSPSRPPYVQSRTPPCCSHIHRSTPWWCIRDVDIPEVCSSSCSTPHGNALVGRFLWFRICDGQGTYLDGRVLPLKLAPCWRVQTSSTLFPCFPSSQLEPLQCRNERESTPLSVMLGVTKKMSDGEMMEIENKAGVLNLKIDSTKSHTGFAQQVPCRCITVQ